jgi:uncharacterized phage infection (PIP) family protein YhgE
MFGLVGLIFIVSLILYSVCKTIVGFSEAQNATFIFGFVGGGCFLASFVFNYFGSNASGSSYLTLPASSLEKWLCGIIITGIIFPSVFLLFYRLMDFSFVALYHNSLDPNNPNYKELYSDVTTFPLTGFVAQKSYFMFLNFTGVMLAGTLYFNKAAFIKVALIVSSLIIGGFVLDHLMAKSIFKSIDKALPFDAVFIAVGKDFGKVDLPPSASNAVHLLFLYILPAIFWIVAYVRLKEKEF